MSKNITTIKLDPGTIKFFVKGVDITDLVKSAAVKTMNEVADHVSHNAPDFSIAVNEEHSITLELDLKGSNIQVDAVGSDMDIHIGEYPTDEFIAEMVRLKFRREGILK